MIEELCDSEKPTPVNALSKPREDQRRNMFLSVFLIDLDISCWIPSRFSFAIQGLLVGILRSQELQ